MVYTAWSRDHPWTNHTALVLARTLVNETDDDNVTREVARFEWEGDWTAATKLFHNRTFPYICEKPTKSKTCLASSSDCFWHK